MLKWFILSNIKYIMKITDVVSYTPCKMAVRLDDYKYFYMIEFFRNNKIAMYDFLEGLVIDGIYKQDNNDIGRAPIGHSIHVHQNIHRQI